MVGGKKRSYYHDDIWNIKYLKGFKWHHLTEQNAYERQVREAKIRQEMTLAKRESRFLLEKLSQSKAISSMDKRRKRKAEKEGGDESALLKKAKPARRFHQREAVKTGQKADDGLLQKILSGKYKKED